MLLSRLRVFKSGAIYLLTTAVLLGAFYGCAGSPEAPELTAEITETPEPTAMLPSATLPPPAEMEGVPVSTITEAPTPVIPDSPAPATPDLTGPDVPLRDEPANDEYFSDAVFIGNSLVDGFGLYGGIKTCDILATTSLSVLGVVSAYEHSLSLKQYGKVYTLLGINEIGFEPDYFKSLYATMLGRIAELQPDAMIFIMGLTPISAEKSMSGGSFTMEKINQYNDALYELACENGYYYIDLCEALSDETGYLPDAATRDGIHFTSDMYTVWAEYLKTHYI